MERIRARAAGIVSGCHIMKHPVIVRAEPDRIDRWIDEPGRRLAAGSRLLIHQSHEACPQRCGAACTVESTRSAIIVNNLNVLGDHRHIRNVPVRGRTAIGGHVDALLPVWDRIGRTDSTAAADATALVPR